MSHSISSPAIYTTCGMANTTAIISPAITPTPSSSSQSTPIQKRGRSSVVTTPPISSPAIYPTIGMANTTAIISPAITPTPSSSSQSTSIQ
jgi:hypothetical protein